VVPAGLELLVDSGISSDRTWDDTDQSYRQVVRAASKAELDRRWSYPAQSNPTWIRPLFREASYDARPETPPSLLMTWPSPT
jgi:hypothetical protein